MSTAAETERAAELKRFLRAMRARLDPGDVGLPALGTRRRVPGLRIEEAAVLADVGLTWYSSLESGKNIRVSAKLLERLVVALRLSAEEREHLFALALPRHEAEAPSIAPPHLQAIIDGFSIGPAFACDRWWNVRLYNRLAGAVYDLECSSERNLLVRMMLDPAYRDLHEEWESIAAQMVGIVRLAYGRALTDPIATALIARLTAESPEFARWWRDYRVRDDAPKSVRLRHRSLGRLHLLMTTFVASSLTARKDRAMILLQPPLDDDTRDALRTIPA